MATTQLSSRRTLRTLTLLRSLASLSLLTLGCSGDAMQDGSGPGGPSGAGSSGIDNGAGNAALPQAGASGSLNAGAGSTTAGTSAVGNGGSLSIEPEPNAPPQAAACEQPEIGAPVLRLLTRFEFQNTINDIFPQIVGQWDNALPANSVTEQGFDNDADAQVGVQTAEGLLRTAESIGDAVATQALSTVLPCAAAADQACADEYLSTIGKRLFRRPLSNAEKERYLTLFNSASSQLDFAGGIKWVTAGLIQSPNAVYRSELGVPSGEGRSLDAFEQATQLAYTFSGSTPSAELLAQAESGTLQDPIGMARSLLDTEKGHGAMRRFFEAYIGYTQVASKQKPAAPGFSEVSADMIEETNAFIEDVLFNQGGTFIDLLTSPTTNPSSALASYYGLGNPASEHAAVDRVAGQGVGLFAQGSFLATRANADSSSPTQRGVYIYTHVLCNVEPPLPNDVPELPSPEADRTTTRQRYEELHAAGPCAGCHALFDPLGFGFEHFDEAGRYRAMEGPFEIDSTGFYKSGGEQVSFDGQEALMSALAEDPRATECFAAYLSTYAFGTTESCLGSNHVSGLKDGSIGVVDAFASLAGEPHFSQRSAQ